MFNWFKKKPENHPEFWKAYEEQFQEKPPSKVSDTRFIVFDTETTGFDYKKDRMLCIGAVTVKENQIDISQTFEYYLKQEKFNPETVKIHGIIQNERIEQVSEEEAVRKFLKFIGTSVLVAHHANFDITMVNAALRRMNLPSLQNRVLDTGKLYRKTRITSNLIDRNKNYSLDEIAEAYNIDIKDRHTAAGDAFITAIAFLKIVGRLDKSGNLLYKELTED